MPRRKKGNGVPGVSQISWLAEVGYIQAQIDIKKRSWGWKKQGVPCFEDERPPLGNKEKKLEKRILRKRVKS